MVYFLILIGSFLLKIFIQIIFFKLYLKILQTRQNFLKFYFINLEQIYHLIFKNNYSISIIFNK